VPHQEQRARKRLLAAAPTMPIVPPAPARTSDSITIDLATRRGDAPSAIPQRNFTTPLHHGAGEHGAHTTGRL
jgi:hypothetical protein